MQINTDAPGYSPLEAEQRITFPVEIAMSGLPGLENTRSLSKYGLSQVTVVFKDGTDIYFARQLINERLGQMKSQLPPGLEPTMGPIATGLGEIFYYLVEADPNARTPEGKPYTPTDLRTIQDWVIKPQLRNVPGVIEVNTSGGFEKQFHVTPDPQRLVAYGLSLPDIVAALEKNNANVGAGYIERNGEQSLIRVPGQVANVADLQGIILGSRGGVPIRIRDVAEVGLGEELRTGAATHNGQEVVLATAVMLLGENSRVVSVRVADRLAQINKTLPAGVHAVTVYNRTNLVDSTIATVKKNLAEGAILVVVILFLLLGNIRAALLTALVIPLSMLFTVTGMVAGKVSGNLMSLGALDFGIIVDGGVIIVENCLRHLAEEQHRRGRLLTAAERFEAVFVSTREVIRPSILGSIIIMVVYLPILTLTGVEGKLFAPMAFTVLAALLGAMIFSVTFVPAAIAILIRGKVSEKENFIMRGASAVYKPLLYASLAARPAVVAASVVLVALSFLLATRLGTEFIPSLDEGDAAVQALRMPGTGLAQSVEMQGTLERKILEFPEVKEAFARIGTAEVATDPMPPSIADGYVMLKPQQEWPDPSRTKADLLEKMQAALADVPGNNYEISQPIQLRFNELISGIRSDLGVKIFGDDMDTLLRAGTEIGEILEKLPGAADVKVEQVTGLPFLTVELDRETLSRHGLNVSDVQETIQIALGGKAAGQVFEGDRRFDIVVRLPEDLRSDLEALRRLPIPLPTADREETGKGKTVRQVVNPDGGAPAFIPLGAVARFDARPGPNQVSRENGKRRIVVSANVRGRDLGGFVAEAQARLGAGIKLPPGYFLEYGGQFENLVSASNRLKIVVPAALAIIFVLLYVTFGNFPRQPAGVHRRADGADGRHPVPLAAGHRVVHLRGRGLHRALGRGRAQRAGDDLVHQPATGGRQEH